MDHSAHCAIFETDLLFQTQKELNRNLLTAVIYGTVKTTRKLIEAGANINYQNEHGITPLMRSCLRKSNDVLTFLLDKGASTELKDEFGWTALFWAVRAKNCDAASLLINQGAKYDLTDYAGFTLLEYARHKDRLVYESVQCLIEAIKSNEKHLVPVKMSKSCIVS